MPNIAQLQDRILDYERQISEITATGEVSTEDQVRAAQLEGRLNETRDALMAAARDLQAENERIMAEASANSQEILRDAAELILGPRDSFTGLEQGWRNTVNMADLRMAMAAARNAVSGLTTPQIYSTDLPQPFATPMGFIDTIPKGLTDGDEHYFQAPAFTNAAAGWTSGNKPESSIEWTPQVAHLETVAHYIPIAKQTARRYRSLESTVSTTLLLGLALRKGQYAVSGANSNGIVGVMNQTGILTYTKQTGENVYDMACNMRTKVRLGCGFTPDCVAMPSAVATSLKTAKGEDGHYLYPEIVKDGKLDGMTIVEDENVIVSTTSDGTTTTANYMMVYFSGGCSWNVADEDQVDVGLIANQFIQNAYTLLAEGTYALKVPFPKAFCIAAV